MFLIDIKGNLPRDSLSGTHIQNLDRLLEILSDKHEKKNSILPQELDDFLNRVQQSGLWGLQHSLIDGSYFQLLIETGEALHCVKVNLSETDIENLDLHLRRVEVYGHFREQTLKYLANKPELEKLIITNCQFSLVSGRDRFQAQKIQFLQNSLRGVRHIQLQGSLLFLGGLNSVLPNLSQLKVLSLLIDNRQQQLDALRVYLPTLLYVIPPNLEELTIPWIKLDCLARRVYEACERTVSLKSVYLQKYSDFYDLSDEEGYLKNSILHFGVSIAGSGKFYSERKFSTSPELKVILRLLALDESGKLCVDMRCLLVKMIFGDYPRAHIRLD